MAYEKNLDIVLEEKQVGEYKIAIMVYNGGDKKLAITKKTMIKDQETNKMIEVQTSKIGRIPIDLAEELAQSILELIS